MRFVNITCRWFKRDVPSVTEETINGLTQQQSLSLFAAICDKVMGKVSDDTQKKVLDPEDAALKSQFYRSYFRDAWLTTGP